jgi:hypothetical protein
MAKIELKRGNGYKDTFRAYQIELDHKKIGTIKTEEALSFDIPPGKYRLRMTIDWCSSCYLIFEITDQQTLHFEGGNNVPIFSVSHGFSQFHPSPR